MSTENVELAWRGYAAVQRGDLDAVRDLLAPEVTWHGGDASAVDACHERRTLPALRALLDPPFVRVLVSHGEPVHDRSAYETALELAPWTEEGSG